ncbi:glucose-1-phosphate thymidylyltransferase [Cohnella xylanilytica]|uniref:Glucose-1-phosphate thymidylyltransferase n=1 Tax=Cohnella xylanilytica TaxID=557555 RepID=A0A841U7Z3_9BACL|nr:sugar phosphate nucleotidyltransferase [Cohnella xylanilytica]MBB6694141.1 NTP transferase domain-containing protein [Cohnella xylanilytica]GIO11055.1 glucose-1-phosphate thymidylyltransferase [Cohnella xylanilytica]
MKAVILAGGTGTRLKPLTFWTNKHLLPVGHYPMICYGVAKLREAGIRDIVIVTTRLALGAFAEVLGSGRDWGVSIVYRVQEEAGGIAQALELARPVMAEGEKFVVLLGDNLFEQSLRPFVEDFERQTSGAMVLLKEVDDPRRYGVPKLEEGSGRIAFIEEKPENPLSPYCVTGMYFYPSDVFEIIDKVHPSDRGELEITDVNNVYAREGRLGYQVLDGWWTDAGTFDSLEEAGRRLKGTLP